MSPFVEEDVVEDSEPEREALRQKRRLERKKRKEARVPTVASGIDLCDDDQNDAPVVPASASIGSVIGISDDSVSAASSHSWHGVPVKGVSQSARLHDCTTSSSEPQLPKKKYADPILNDSAIFSDSLENEDDDELGLNLARFAFPAQPTRKASSSTVTSRTESADVISKPVAPKQPHRTDRFSEDFTDVQLGGLLKCICCNISWTTRKSAAQKMKHVQSCAKKNSFSDSAVRTRIRQALESVDPKDLATKGRGRAKSQDATVPETFFRDVVHDVGPRKRTKRVDVLGTVKALVDTRDAILQKAETIIGHSASSSTHLLLSDANGHGIAATQDPGRSVLPERMAYDNSPLLWNPLHSDGDADLYPATQAFGPSKFGAEPASSTPSTLPSPTVDEPFPATQAFAPSKLGSRQAASSSPLSYCSNRSSINSSLSLTPSSSNARSPRSPLPTASLLPPYDMLPLQDGYYSDLSEACLHFDPHLDNNHIETSSPHTTQSIPVQSAKRRNKAATSTTSEKKSSAKDRRKGKGKAVKKRWKEKDFDANWEEELKKKIMRDTELYQRILRYEASIPMISSFNFFKLAGAEEDRPANGIFTLKLRCFLDGQVRLFMKLPNVNGLQRSW
ncbi:uncharacterized protein BT62DRAFT_1073586 [Guyanagaster necrorhizus]|uniref:Uncharacterized protein n=1 Tax=Guyanagaster necrorhizus TaxID=856835 RepID=A0A9P7VYF9_9AGAR|nr:uncharacterized protein BT62DRAFT_1073586 [Guyanagaster necrorhizus MCA 3950]KAG7449050.1 hypothetical protein BT62DRAFT_1073586 [Guyanagaster necrorhizus MCA 3950]